MSRTIVTVNRATCITRPIMIETVAGYVEKGAVVHVEDSFRPRPIRLCYQIRSCEAFYLFNATGQQIGLFADVAALVDHADALTGT